MQAYQAGHPNCSSIDEDYKMQYIRGTKDLTLTIEPSADPKWWVYSIFDVHPDMRSYAGVVMSLGKEATYSSLTKQNSTQNVPWRLNEWP